MIAFIETYDTCTYLPLHQNLNETSPTGRIYWPVPRSHTFWKSPNWDDHHDIFFLGIPWGGKISQVKVCTLYHGSHCQLSLLLALIWNTRSGTSLLFSDGNQTWLSLIIMWVVPMLELSAWLNTCKYLPRMLWRIDLDTNHSKLTQPRKALALTWLNVSQESWHLYLSNLYQLHFVFPLQWN